MEVRAKVMALEIGEDVGDHDGISVRQELREILPIFEGRKERGGPWQRAG